MERQFNACQTPRSMYLSIFNSFRVIRCLTHTSGTNRQTDDDCYAQRESWRLDCGANCLWTGTEGLSRAIAVVCPVDSSLYAVRHGQASHGISPVPCADRTWNHRVTRASALAWECRSGQQWHAAITRASPTWCAFFAADATSALPTGRQPSDSLVSSEPATAAASGSPASHVDHALTASSPRSSCSWPVMIHTGRLFMSEKTDCGYRTGNSWCPHGARTMPVRLYMSHGHREATVRTSCGARTVIVGIARASCDFLGCKNITKSYGDRTATVRQSCGLRPAPVRCCLRWIYRLRCLRRIVRI